MSISSSSVGNGATLSGAQSTKKTNTHVRKITSDIQKHMLKGYVLGKPDSNNGILELSTRTPDKSNPEMSPYMIDFYK